MVPKAVIFDLGKVLLEFDFQIFARRLSADASLEAPEIMDRVVGSDVLVDYEYGRTSSDQFFDQVRELSGFQGDYASFESIFGEIFTEIPEMIELQQQLKEQGVPTYIFSNTNDIAVKVIRRNYGFFAGFSDYILSYEHESMKPEGKLYDVVETVTGLSGSELVFMDDKSENIDAARARGWHGIVHVSHETTLGALRDLGFQLQ